MGYMCHHAIIVSCWNTDALEKARAKAIALFTDPGLAGDDALMGHDFGQLVSPVLNSVINHERTFFIAPDGSKEGWITSDHGDRCRDAFIAWLDLQRYEDGGSALKWALVQYGDDNQDDRMLQSDATNEPDFESA